MKIYLDIETVALEDQSFFMPAREGFTAGNTKDPAKLDAKYVEKCESIADKAALHAEQSKVAILGVSDEMEYTGLVGSESQILSEFWSKVRRCINSGGSQVTQDGQGSFQFVGHNIKNFDLPFICRRSLINGVKIPALIYKDLFSYRPKFVFDTAIEWAMGERGKYTHLVTLCHVFGVESPKTTITGATFGNWWRGEANPELSLEQHRQCCLDYNRDDVLATRKIAIKMGV